MQTSHTILKVLVGSRAHGLAGPESDEDVRSVFVIPTEEMFRLHFKYQGTRWAKGNGDETSWEIGQFLALAVQCHPLILETLVAPVLQMDEWGEELRALLPACWSPQGAYEAFVGYSLNQRRKFLDKKDGRPSKYAAAYIRVLYHLCELLETGTFRIRVVDSPIGALLGRIKDGNYRIGEIIDAGEAWTDEARKRLAHCRQKADIQAVDAFLVRIRRAFLG